MSRHKQSYKISRRERRALRNAALQPQVPLIDSPVGKFAISQRDAAFNLALADGCKSSVDEVRAVIADMGEEQFRFRYENDFDFHMEINAKINAAQTILALIGDKTEMKIL